MDNDLIKQNFTNVVVKIIDYLCEQQSNNNTNEEIPNIDEEMNFSNIFSNMVKNTDSFFNNTINSWKKYYEFQSLISKEFIEEFEKRKFDGILIADLELCKKRLINEDIAKENSSYIEIDNINGIHIKESVKKK